MKGSATRHELVCVSIRADILAGRLRPGRRLPFADLCGRYQASVGVIREALTRLVEQGLVTAESQQGYRVTPVSPADLLTLTDARCELEALALRRAIRDGDLGWESQVLAAHHRLERTAQMDPADAGRVSENWAAAHAAYHATLLAGCANERLRSIAAGLRDAAELYRLWSVPLGSERDRDIAAEHRELLDGVLTREPERASRALISHIEVTTRVLLTGAADQPDHADEAV